MIKVRVHRNKLSEIDGFTVSGHAGYANRDEDDIICAAVSAIAYTAVGYFCEVGYQDSALTVIRNGYMDWKKPLITDEKMNLKANGVLEAMVIGLKQVEYTYGDKYLKVDDMGGAVSC